MELHSIFFTFSITVMLILTSQTAQATFSIVACDTSTGRCGVAVATHNLAVGDGVPFAKANVGAGVSQFETNPRHREIILKSLLNGNSAETALEKAIKYDAEFTDGKDMSFRQIAVVSYGGNAAAHTGGKASSYAGHLFKDSVSVQGNGLASEAVLDAMWDSFHGADGSLEEKLITALEAGYASGGQKIGVTSAALLVSTPEGWPVDTDLRTDFNSDTAISDLRKVYDANVARQHLFRARLFLSSGNKKVANQLVEKALELAPDWDRIWLNAGRIAKEEGDRRLAKERFCRFQDINPVWAELLSDQIDLTDCKK